MKTSLENVLETRLEDALKTPWRPLEIWKMVSLKTSSRDLQAVLENKECLLSISFQKLRNRCKNHSQEIKSNFSTSLNEPMNNSLHMNFSIEVQGRWYNYFQLLWRQLLFRKAFDSYFWGKLPFHFWSSLS